MIADVSRRQALRALAAAWLPQKPAPNIFKPSDRLLAFCDLHRCAVMPDLERMGSGWVKNMSTGERRAFFEEQVDRR